MIRTGKVEIQNCPAETDKYIVARAFMGELWFWGSWEKKEAAKRVADTFDNGIVIERCEDER